MQVFTCEPDWESMLSCMYEAWASKLGHKNISLALEPVDQYTLFDSYVHVDYDPDKSDSVALAVKRNISPYFYSQLAYASMAYEPEILDVIYRVMILGFAYGAGVLNDVRYEAVMRLREISTRVGKEACRFKEAVRFHEVAKGLLVAHIEPKSRILVTTGPAFEDRMPSENWMIIDDVHREAVIHPKNTEFYMRKLTEYELEQLLETEKANDRYTDMWKVFFDSISIKERENYRLQRNHSPLWARKHIVEFNYRIPN